MTPVYTHTHTHTHHLQMMWIKIFVKIEIFFKQMIFERGRRISGAAFEANC